MKEQDTSKINRIKSETIKLKTGKDWREWFDVLNSANSLSLSHQQIVEYLSEHHHLGPWWSQMVTVGYEQFHGKREIHQKPNGYEISVSKTICISLDALFNAFLNEDIRQGWLSENIVIRKSTLNKSIRISWEDLTSVVVDFYAKDSTKSQVVIQHATLLDKNMAEDKKLFWKEKLDKLKTLLEK